MQGHRPASGRRWAVRARGAAFDGLDAIRGQWPVLLLVVLLMVGLGVLVSAAGPAQFGQPRVGSVLGLHSALPDGGAAAPHVAGGPDASKEAQATLPGWTTVIWMLAVCMLLVLVVRWAVRLLGPAEDRKDGRAKGAADAVQDIDPGFGLREGVREAAKALDVEAERGNERDAVILCWLALEQAASKAGWRRLDSQTPTEFTSALLTRSGVDPAATSELLALYHRARFGVRPLPAGCSDRARSALERMAAALAAQPSAHAPVRRAHD